jgi:hypothetical protein
VSGTLVSGSSGASITSSSVAGSGGETDASDALSGAAVADPATSAAAAGFFFRGAGALACLYSCSASHVVQRVCFTSFSIMATTAWLVMRRSRGQ